MTDLGALLYADRRSLVNALREIVRQPGRRATWLLWLLLIGLGLVLRTTARAGSEPAVVERCDLLVCGAAILCGVLLVHASRFVGLFGHRAEALTIVTSPLSPPVAAIYIQLRELVRRSGRFAAGAFYTLCVLLPTRVGAQALLRDLLLVAAATLALGTVPLPRRLAPPPLAAVATAIGGAAIVLGALPLLRDAAAAFAPPAARLSLERALPPWHPGVVLLEPVGPRSVLLILVLLSGAALGLLAIGRAARDAYPELYALSLARLERSRQPRRPLGALLDAAQRPQRVASSRLDRIPGGVAVFVWRAWTEYRHGHTARGMLVEALLPILGGFAAGRLIGGRPEPWLPVGGGGVSLLLAFGVAFGGPLAAELRRQLFWLGSATPFERLLALLLARCWRPLLWSALSGVGLALGGAYGPAVGAAWSVLPAIALLIGALAFATYALVPHELDQRGPLAAARMLAAWLCLLPALAGGTALGVLLRSAGVGLTLAAILLLVESAALVGFAARRLDPTIRSGPRRPAAGTADEGA